LTAITEPPEVIEKHLLDSIAVLPELARVPDGSTVLDFGAGAGFPGLPLKVLRPGLQVVMVESVGKKVGFIKHAVARLQLGPLARGVQVTAAGDPAREKLPLADVAISRAFAEPSVFVPLARSYLTAHGQVVCMLGKPGDEGASRELAVRESLNWLGQRTYRLPFGGADRAVSVFSKP
jgi:16S rRNA (guanine527-N7)-methyltransferase